MKNNIICLFIACGFFGLLAFSCIDDKGNYVYEDATSIMPVTISGIIDTSIVIGTNLKIVPELQHGNSEYTYTWYTLPNNPMASGIPNKTILSGMRDLDITVRLDAGDYYLNFEVKDEARDIYVREQVKLKVTATDINTGWYVLKDVGNETDFDYINSKGELYPDVLLNRAIPENSRLRGTAVKMILQSDRYSHNQINPDGTVTRLDNQKALHILSSQDMKTFNANTLSVFKNYEDEFYSLPENCRPQSILLAPMMGDPYLLNNGKIHTINIMSANIGKFSAAKTGFYSMHKDAIAVMQSALFFDLESCSFYSTTPTSSTVSLLSEESPSKPNPLGVSPTNMNAALLDLLLGTNNYLSALGYAVMKNRSKEEYYIAGVNVSGTSYPFTSFDTIPSGCKMPLAKAKAAPYSGSFLYFGDANKLCVYKNASGLANREEVLISFPEDETISYLVNEYNFVNNYLYVLTNSSKEWKLYVYNIAGFGNPELNPEPIYVYSGHGIARYVVNRS